MAYINVSLSPTVARSGMGSLLDANINTKAYYICLVEVWDNKLGLRSYKWTDYRYLSNWDAMGFSLGFDKTLQGGRQTAILYQWTVSPLTGAGKWVKV